MPNSWEKDPASILDYTVDWVDWLQSLETIATSTWTVPTGLTKMLASPHTESKTGTAATVWLSGGTNGENYTVTNTIVTNQSRTEERSITIRVRQR